MHLQQRCQMVDHDLSVPISYSRFHYAPDNEKPSTAIFESNCPTLIVSHLDSPQFPPCDIKDVKSQVMYVSHLNRT
ncbi:hypothetical protein AL755_18140 [Arthrobacter sp. ERGS1:01]|nr:hypothetical protein AL755_18140 [Arthrobacter sp. ERGS1:01]